MKKMKKWLTSPITTVVLFAVAAVMLLFSSIGGTRAALRESSTYKARFDVSAIGVALVENGEVTEDVLLADLLGDDDQLKPGKAYPEALAVRNVGDGKKGIDQYVRVTITKSWKDKDGDKITDLSPDLIKLNLVNEGSWIEDTDAKTTERTVLYYTRPLTYQETTPLFADQLTIDGYLVSKVTQETIEEGGFTTIVTTYDYDGVSFDVKVVVDAVQDHNAADAIHSAWGRRVTIAADGTLSLAQ